MSGEMLISLDVNGREYSVAVRPETTLLSLIRETLDLTGTKAGCGMGDCGACTVLLDGRPVNSCLALAVEADGCKVVTIEGLTEDGDLHELQKAFVKHGALQCGYCTPGMLMAAKTLVDTNPDPDESEIREALAGNLCRCGTYDRIKKAIRRAADQLPETGAAGGWPDG